MTMVGLEAVGVGFALLAPVYALLFQIQRRLGCFEARLRHIDERVEDNEAELSA